MSLSHDQTASAPEVVAPAAIPSTDPEKAELVQEDIVSAEASEKNTQISSQDEGKNIGGHDSVDLDAVAESRLLKKLDRNMIPLLFVLCE
jgi:hypothetical protein